MSAVGVGVFSAVLGDLVDRLSEWETERRRNRTVLLDKSVMPLYEAINVVHSDYARSFGEYVALIETYKGFDGCPHLFSRIENDMLLTSALRTKIENLRIQALAPEMVEFRERINGYLRFAMRVHRLDSFDNAPRLALLAELDIILRPGLTRPPEVAIHDHQRARRVIGRRLRQLDEKYGAIVAEYARLQIRLTK